MSAMLRVVCVAAKGLLQLHPFAYRADFGDEVQAVLSRNLADAEAEGLGALARVGGREVVGLGASLIREQWARLERRGSGSGGAFGWNGLAVALAFLVLRLDESLGPIGRSAIVLLAGALCGLLLRPIGRSRLRNRGRAGLGALVFLVGDLAIDASANLITAWWAPDTTAWMAVMLIVVEPIILGFCVAILFSRIGAPDQPVLSLLLRTGLAAVAGAGVGMTLTFVSWALGQMLDSWRVGYDGRLSPWVLELSHILLRFAIVVVAGWFAGSQLRSRVLHPGPSDAARIA